MSDSIMASLGLASFQEPERQGGQACSVRPGDAGAGAHPPAVGMGVPEPLPAVRARGEPEGRLCGARTTT